VSVSFSAPVQTSPEAHTTSSTMGTGSFSWVKRPVHGADHPPPSIVVVKERAELYFYSSTAPSWPILGERYFCQFAVQPRFTDNTVTDERDSNKIQTDKRHSLILNVDLCEYFISAPLSVAARYNS